MAETCPLMRAVMHCSQERVVLEKNPDVGRCLAASVPLQRGDVIVDLPLFLGSEHGQAMLRVCTDAVPRQFQSLDLVADLDIAASLVENLASAQPSALELRQLAEQLIPAESGTEESAPRTLWKMLREELRATVPLEALLDLWLRLPGNWRRTKTSPVKGSFVLCPCDGAAVKEATAEPSLSCETSSGLFLLSALAEHSCMPNISPRFEDGKLSLLVIRPISIGERLTMSYLNSEELCLPCPQRRNWLEVGWGFLCRCSRCLKEELGREKPYAALALMSSSLKRAFSCNSGDEYHEADAAIIGCQDMASRAARDMLRLFGCWEPTALELRFFSLLLGARGAEMGELVGDCMELLGGESPFTVAVQLLGDDPRGFLQQILQEGREDAAAVGVRCASTFDECSTQGNNLLLKLFRQHHYSTRRPVLLPCGSRYVQQLAPLAVGSQIVERSSQTVVECNRQAVSPTGQQHGGGQAPRQSRFRARLHAERGGGAHSTA